MIKRAPREEFYSPERPSCSLYVLLEGSASVARFTSDGKRLVTGLLGAGDVFGDISLCGSTTDNEVAEAVTDCCALALDARKARALVASDPSLALRILDAVARRVSATSDRLEEFACRPVEARLASALLRITDSGSPTAPVSHQVLADIAGANRETASRVLGDLQARAVLRLGRCSIEIEKPQMLASAASG